MTASGIARVDHGPMQGAFQCPFPRAQIQMGHQRLAPMTLHAPLCEDGSYVFGKGDLRSCLRPAKQRDAQQQGPKPDTVAAGSLRDSTFALLGPRLATTLSECRSCCQ